MPIKLYSATLAGVEPHLVEIEIDYSNEVGNKIFVVGLSEYSIKEGRRRILTALKNQEIPAVERNLIVNLAPADLKKEGALFDVPIAIAISILLKKIKPENSFMEDTIFLGELALDGNIRAIKGALSIALNAKKMGKTRIIMPYQNALECRLVSDIEILGVHNLTQLFNFLNHKTDIAPLAPINIQDKLCSNYSIDFNEVKGQHQAKRALQIAAAGRHNIVFVGPPGSGKTMLAKRLTTIMPPMTITEVFETSQVYSIGGRLNDGQLIFQRPFRDPHHSSTSIGLMGGGVAVQPGEISLAHNGILFLDELTEFNRSTLENLRQPLEEGIVRISRSHANYTFPASFLLVAALNPCPCGYYNTNVKKCTCSTLMVNRYLNKLSGPLLDRIDLQININAVEYDDLKNKSNETSSAELYAGVMIAKNKQQERFKNSKCNAHMNTKEVETYCQLNAEGESLIKIAFEKLNLSLRSYHKILKISRTIADLDNSEIIETKHIKEALMYRSLEKTINRL